MCVCVCVCVCVCETRCSREYQVWHVQILMRLTASHTPFTSPSPPPVITHTSIVRGLLVIPTLSYTLLKHKFPTVPHCERCTHDYKCGGRGAEVSFCGIRLVQHSSDFTVAMWKRETVCEHTAIRRQFWKILNSLSHRFWVQADEYVLPRRIFFSYPHLKVDISEMLQNSFFSQVFPAI